MHSELSEIDNYEPLLVLSKTLLNKQVIGIGESSHGSTDLHNAAINLIKTLILNNSISIIYLEAPEESIQGMKCVSNSDYSKAEQSNYFIWRTKPVRDFFEWLRVYNNFTDSPIEIKGFDIRQPSLSITRLLNYCETLSIDSSLIKSTLKLTIGNFSLKGFQKLEPKIMAGEQHLEEQHVMSSLKQLSDLNAQLASKNIHDLAINQAFLDIVSIKSWLETYRETNIDYLDIFAKRDQGLFDVLNLSLHQNPQQKAVVWAHLGHLLKKNQSVESSFSFVNQPKLLGTMLSDKLGPNYSVIAVMGASLNVVGPGNIKTNFTTNEDSIESKLLAHYSEYPVIQPVSNLPKSITETAQWIGKSDNINSRLKENNPSFKVVIPQQMDGVIILPNTK